MRARRDDVGQHRVLVVTRLQRKLRGACMALQQRLEQLAIHVEHRLAHGLLAGERWREIAGCAQRTYRRYLFEREGREEFCARLASIVQGCGLLPH